MNGRYLARLRPHLVGTKRPRRHLAAGVAVLVVIATTGFLLGVDAALSLGWIAVVFGIAVAGGTWGAGFILTAVTLWLVGFWWTAFPPLAGYLTGGWAPVSRYTYPRTLDYAAVSARAELVGGIEQGVRIGLLFAVVLGASGYLIGVGISRLRLR
ncbi:hypothetical protein [Halorubrum tibetense]|uniref:DUF2062 domain-containing protein n=1 Tax=Halorubrum tibetense TaxID=175631 RepID=A0ABD5SAU3_9EURY